MATSILLKFLTLKWNISRTIWRIELSGGLFFRSFHARLYELDLFSDRRFPLTKSFCSTGLARYTDFDFTFDLSFFIHEDKKNWFPFFLSPKSKMAAK